MPSCNTYCLNWVSLTLVVGYLLTAAPPNLEHRVAPLGPPAPRSHGSLALDVKPKSIRERGFGFYFQRAEWKSEPEPRREHIFILGKEKKGHKMHRNQVLRMSKPT